MTNSWQCQLRVLAVVICVSVWPSPLDLHAQTTFRAEVVGSHLPTYGNAYELLAEGERGELSVVALARPDGVSKRIAFVVRNGTPDVLIPWVTATARVGDTGETRDGMAFNPNGFPFITEPGNLMIGEIFFESPVPTDAVLDVTVTGEQPNPDLRMFSLQEDFGSLQLDAFDADSGTGTVSNQEMRGSAFLDFFWRRMVCFEDGELQRLVIIDIEAGDLGPGDSSPFRLMQAEPGECERFIFAGHGTLCEFMRTNVRVCGPDRRADGGRYASAPSETPT